MSFVDPSVHMTQKPLNQDTLLNKIETSPIVNDIMTGEGVLATIQYPDGVTLQILDSTVTESAATQSSTGTLSMTQVQYYEQFIQENGARIVALLVSGILVALDPGMELFACELADAAGSALMTYFSDPGDLQNFAAELSSGQLGDVAAALFGIAGTALNTFMDSLSFLQMAEYVAQGIGWGAVGFVTGGTAQLVSSSVGMALIGGGLGALAGEAYNGWCSYSNTG